MSAPKTMRTRWRCPTCLREATLEHDDAGVWAVAEFIGKAHREAAPDCPGVADDIQILSVLPARGQPAQLEEAVRATVQRVRQHDMLRQCARELDRRKAEAAKAAKVDEAQPLPGAGEENA